MKPLRVRTSRGAERRQAAFQINRKRPAIPGDLTTEEFSWLRQTEGAVALLYRIKHASAIHGVKWVMNMARYYRQAADSLLDSAPARLQAVARHYRRKVA